MRQIDLRLPDDLEEGARLQAERMGVSLHEWLVFAVSVAVGQPGLVSDETAADALLARLRGGRSDEELEREAQSWLDAQAKLLGKASKAQVNRPKKPRKGGTPRAR